MLIFVLCGLLAVRLDGIERLSLRTAGALVVNDGDTLTQGGERIRLKGIDAFETGQTCMLDGNAYDCGRRAAQALYDLIAGADVSCEGAGRDRYGRLLATCSARGRDLNASLVAAGWALAYGGYEAQEAEARIARRGAWAGEFDAPSAWRAARGGAGEVPHAMVETVISWLRRLFPAG